MNFIAKSLNTSLQMLSDFFIDIKLFNMVQFFDVSLVICRAFQPHNEVLIAHG